MVDSINAFLLREHKQNRITGNQYAELMSRGLEYASQHSFQFALAKESALNEFKLRKQALLDEQQRFLENLAFTKESQRIEHEHDLVKQSKTFEHELVRQGIDHTHDSTKQATEHTFTAAEAALNRTHDRDKQTADHTHTAAEAVISRAHDLTKQSADHTFTASESALNRTHELSKQSKDHTHDLAKFNQQITIQEQKLALEQAMNTANVKLTESQSKAFKGKHNKDMAKLIMDIVTVGVAQEQMDILAGPNPVFGGISPSTVFNDAAWPVSV